MKRTVALLLTVLLTVGLLAGCGGGQGEQSGAQTADLTSFYDEMAQEYEWDNGYMVDIESEMLDSYYPGLSDIPTKQFLAKMPMMSSVVSEIVLMECETEEDAAAAAPILQDRIDTQAAGGAWYPESMEAWGRSIVIQQGTFVAMIASAEHQDEIVDGFNTLFQ